MSKPSTQPIQLVVCIITCLPKSTTLFRTYGGTSCPSMTPADVAAPAASTTCPTSRAYGQSPYMRDASVEHDWVCPISAALRIHCSARRLLRVTPRPRAWQIMLATSCDAIQLKKRGSKKWKMTRQSLSGRPCRGRQCTWCRCCAPRTRGPRRPRASTSPTPPGSPAPPCPSPRRDKARG